MGIPDEDVARVRAETDIVALIGEHATLKRVGQRWQGLCPFHGEKTPSFSVNAEEGFYYCFGCLAKGDAISFVRAMEHLDFVDAVRRLADRAGITIREDAGSGRDSQRRKVFLDAMERATEWYHQRLLTSPDAGAARDYLRSRGYDGEVVRRFRLGWAPDDWDALCTGLGLSQELAVGAGLGFVNRRGRLQDAFRARVLFPICDPSGHPVALGGRVLPGSPDPAKYKNSSETPIYSKRRCSTPSTGPSRRSSSRARWWCARGTPTSSAVRRRRAARRGHLRDGPGRGAREAAPGLRLPGGAGLRRRRGRPVGRRTLLRVGAPARHRRRRGRLAGRLRPGEMARSDPDGLRAAIEEAKPFLQFRVERILGAAELGTPEGRARAADSALAAVAEHPDNLVRDQYLMQVAERCRLEPLLLRERLEQLRRDGPRPDEARPQGRRSGAADSG